MSLLDALLLDPYRINVWIAYRTDGVKGSGTQNDPYDGSTKLAAPVTISSLVNSGLEATATTSASHGYSNNDIITVDVQTNPQGWSGTFLIYGVTSTTFKYLMNNVPGGTASGTRTASEVLDLRFDNIMNALGGNTCIHLGPTSGNRPFLTKGYKVEGALGLQVKPAMKITGSGVDVTTLRLIGQPGTLYAIAHDFADGPVDHFELSELTIDANLMVPTANSAFCGAVRVMGNHARVRRIKVVNWGANAAIPGFVVSMVTADADFGLTGVTDCGIEEVIAVSPAASPSGALITVLQAGPKDDSGSNAEGYGIGPFIRNCFVDCGSPNADADYRGLSMAWCKGGIVEGNHVHNTKYGGPYISKSSARGLVVRGNFYKNVAKGPFWNLAVLSATSLSSLVRDTDQTIAVATTSSAHGMLAGDRVKIDVSGAASYYEGIFVIKDVPASTTFRYQMQGNPGGNGSSPTMQKVFGVAKLVVEGNTIELATGSTGDASIHLHDNVLSPQTPDYAHGDVIIRDNKIRYLDGAFESGFTGYGVQVNGARNAQIRDNVVEVIPDNPLKNIRCGSVQYFNNREPDGVLIQGINESNNNKKYDELETEAEDAMVMALFKRTE